MAFSKVGPHNDNGNEVLVYIRRLNGDTPPPGNWSSFDYHVMAALPTNDNVRYAVYNIADDFTYNATDGYYQNQDILTERYYKYKFGPSDIKYQLGTYPPAYGNMNNTLVNNDLNPELLLRAFFPPTGDGRIVYRSLLEEVKNPNNEVIRYESLQNDIDGLISKLDMPPSQRSLGYYKKSKRRDDSVHYSIMYDSETREFVEEGMKDYLERFDYKFENN